MSGDREPWIAVKIGAVEHPKVLELPGDSARWGLVVLWSKAKKQRPSGIFRSEVVARELLGRHGRYLPAYIGGGFVHVAPVVCPEKRCAAAYADLPAPSLAVHDWHAYQRDHALRQLAYRLSDGATDAGSDGPSDVVSDITSRALSMVDSQESSYDVEGGPGETADLWALYGALTRTVARKPATLDWLERIETTYGLGPSAHALREEHAKDPNPGTLLSRTSARLEVEARRAETNGAAAKRQERVTSKVWERRMEEYRHTEVWRPEWGEQPAEVPA